MSRWLLLALCLIPAAVGAQQRAIPRTPELSIVVEPRHVHTQGAYVQSQVKLRVMLVSPHPYDELHLDLPPITGARVLTLLKPTTRTIHFYNEVGYVHEIRLAIFPERSGKLQIPSITARGVVDPQQGPPIAFHEQRPAFAIDVKPINPDLETDWWLVADGITLEERWSPDPDDWHVGDTVQRHVTLRAQGVTVEQVPRVDQPRNTGYAVVGVNTKKETELTKEGAIAHVRQSWALLIQTGDVFYISPLRLDYWDPETDSQASATLPAMRVEPLVRDPVKTRQALIDAAVAAHDNRRLGLLVILALPALLALAVLAAVGWTLLPTRADRELRRRCRRAGTPEDCLAAVIAWSNAGFGWTGSAVVERLQATLGPRATEPLDDVQRALFARATQSVAPDRVARSLIAGARRRRLVSLWRWLTTPFRELLRAQHLLPQR